ncbi:alkaline phosphatase [Amnibacterium endophyticum]|uniref:Alkaline phosphatase n=1 Tax=Amnibacterium endophyticum TaxID=2109337 RepID=A0ABW4LGP5_9MICO
MRSPRTRRRIVAVAAAGTAAVLLAGAPAIASSRHIDGTAAARHEIVGGKARNVILLLGDGMGDSEITIARNYQVGADGRLAMDTLPLTGEYTTYALDKDTGKPDYVTDSAASGTGWATGTKTYNGAISVDLQGKPLRTILEQAKKAGYRTGNVTTAEVQDATPAVLESHVVSRDCKGPVATTASCAVNAKENGGAGSISEQEVATRADVLLGGGAKYFDEKITAGRFAGSTVRESAKRSGYQLLSTAADLQAVSAKSKDPVLGTFASGNMDLEWVGPKPTRTGTPASTCSVNTARPATQPHLSDMSAKALQILDARSKHSKKGFFLQIEGASIDKQDHAANPCGQIGETVEFDRAVKLALDYQKRHKDTLVVVTADHGHTSQIVEGPTLGYTATLTTHDGAPMTISYATADIAGSQQHTGTEVRIAAKGPQAANVLGITNQTDLNTTFRRALGLPSGR